MIKLKFVKRKVEGFQNVSYGLTDEIYSLVHESEEDLAEWLEHEAAKTGVPRGQIVREQLEKAKAASAQPFMRLAGSIQGTRDLSRRKGFSKR